MSDTNNTLQIPTHTKTQGDMPPPQVPLQVPTLPTIEVPKIELDAKKEKTMAEFLASMDNYAPIVKKNTVQSHS